MEKGKKVILDYKEHERLLKVEKEFHDLKVRFMTPKEEGEVWVMFNGPLLSESRYLMMKEGTLLKESNDLVEHWQIKYWKLKDETDQQIKLITDRLLKSTNKAITLRGQRDYAFILAFLILIGSIVMMVT